MLQKTAIGGLIVVFGLAGCGSTTPAQTPSSSATNPGVVSQRPTAHASRAQLSEQLDHLHGAVAISEREIIVGTHTGAKKITPAGEVTAQGSSQDDLMGMAGVTGTSTVWSSGHPGPKSAFPNPVGLITSNDAGVTWTPISLQGQVDFHALAIDGTRIAGSGGPALMISDDGGQTWTNGATISPVSLAYSRQTLLATTERGLQASQDFGQSFQPLQSAPALVRVSAGIDDSLAGIDTQGTVWQSVDSGLSWTKLDTITGQYMLATWDSGRVYAISDSEIIHIAPGETSPTPTG